MSDPNASEPTVELIPRHTAATLPDHGSDQPDGDQPDNRPQVWSDVEELLRAGSGTTWLSVGRSAGGVHTRPVFAAWTGDAFVFASNGSTAKSAHLDADGRGSLAIDLSSVHLVVEGRADRLVTPAGLENASAALLEVYGWPTTVIGDVVDAPYGAPTSGGPPYRLYRFTPARAFAFPTADQFEPTRFRF
ncbi:hypothetical protein [Gordonia soli]|uniref:Pyridoxamine 5'-phosphate oxidase putative domain-containing protein n=1 Tax=Gordonia soli NBRC 108243 TaxID=1223545 RepID=M0QEP6_9ACTN|nr:hypothetical protein [Gordonia soli]GAC66796.1 hypothetical protein GS4_05_00040 [Gordonia soli NBRC 108243]